MREANLASHASTGDDRSMEQHLLDDDHRESVRSRAEQRVSTWTSNDLHKARSIGTQPSQITGEGLSEPRPRRDRHRYEGGIWMMSRKPVAIALERLQDGDVVGPRVEQLWRWDGVVEAVLGTRGRGGRSRRRRRWIRRNRRAAGSGSRRIRRIGTFRAGTARGQRYGQRDQNRSPPPPHLTQSKKPRAKSTDQSLCGLRAIPRRSDSFDESL